MSSLEVVFPSVAKVKHVYYYGLNFHPSTQHTMLKSSETYFRKWLLGLRWGHTGVRWVPSSVWSVSSQEDSYVKTKTECHWWQRWRLKLHTCETKESQRFPASHLKLAEARKDSSAVTEGRYPTVTLILDCSLHNRRTDQLLVPCIRN